MSKPESKPLESFFSEPEGAKETPSPVAEPAEEGAKETPSPLAEKVKPAQGEEKVEPKAEGAQTKTEEKAEPAAEKPKEEKEQAAPSFDWENDQNPYKGRYKETRDYATKVEQKASALGHQLEIINKKLDGTYDPETDAVNLKPTPEQAALLARLEASQRVVIDKLAEEIGDSSADQAKAKEELERRMGEFNEGVGKNELVQYRVQNSPLPVMEALKVLEEAKFVSKWGATPQAIEAAIRKDEAAKHEAQIEKIVNQKIEERLKRMEGQPQGLANARGAAPGAEPRGWQPKPMEEIFGQ